MAKIDEAGARVATREIGIWRENWSIVTAFAAISTQWIIVPMFGAPPHYAGLNYAGVAAGLAGHGFEQTPELWAGIQIMEHAMRAALNGGPVVDDDA